MKLLLKRPQRLSKRHFQALSLGSLVVLGISGFVLFKTQVARSAIASDDKFRVVMPSAFTASQSTDVYLEIAQTGKGNTLDAKESWSKFYIDKGRVQQATIGVYRGGYGGEIDTLGVNRGTNGARLPDPDAVKYDFYLAESVSFQGISEETPCTVAGELKSSLTVDSGEMSVDGWYKIDATRFLNNALCGGERWDVTKKTGKYVLFMRASWAGSAPVVSGERQGRVSAFKVGAAYANSSGTLDNPLTGYWSDFDSAYVTQNPEQTPQRAAYSVQDRKSAEGTQGNYTFRFAPDCRMAPEEVEKRYLHWKDVDYPAYYPGQAAPEFDLVEISPSGSKTTVIRVNQNSKSIDGSSVFNGSTQNKHAAIAYNFKGGHTYEWIWRNITRIDGVSFWLPYDDYPSLAGGCGEWSHELGMSAGPSGQLGSNDFKIAGGQTAAINLTQNATGKDSGPATDLDLTVAAASGSSIAAGFSGVSATLGGATSASSTSTSRVLHWENLSPLGGAYPLTRNNLFAYFKAADNAPDGARYCASAVMSPKSNTQLGGTRSTPNQICFTIDNSLKPYVSTSGADVHAGCNLDPIALGNAKIIGPPSNGSGKGSMGSYIVSAGGTITDFGSGGSPSGGALTFGKGGRYGSVCRPDAKTMESYFIKDTGTTISSTDSRYYTSPNFDLSKLPAGGRYKIKVDGDIGIVGQSGSTVTVYATGNVALRGGTVGSNMSVSAPRSKLPVVGIMAKTIAVSKDTSTINAVMYANDTFNTCSISDWVNQCKSTLTIKGFAMAGSFNFRRVSSGSNGLQTGEQVDFNAAFYLNPPPGFGIPANMIKYLGEKAPLY